MYNVPGALVSGTAGFSSPAYVRGSLLVCTGDGLEGERLLANSAGFDGETVVYGGCEFMAGDSVISSSLALSGSHGVVSQISGYLTGEILSIFSIGGSDAGAGCLAVENSFGRGGSVFVKNELKSFFSGFVKVCAPLEDAVTGMLKVFCPLSSGYAGSLKLKCSVDDTAFTAANSVQAFLDGQDKTDRLINAEIKLFGTDIFASFTAELAGGVSGKKAEFLIDGNAFSFVVTGRSFEGNVTKLSGSACGALLEEPYSGYKKYAGSGSKTSELTEGIAEWQTEDFTVMPLFEWFTPIELASALAEEAGAVLRCGADCVNRVVSPCEPYLTAELSVLFSAEYESTEADCKDLKVIWGQTSEPVIETSARKAETGSFIILKVFRNGECEAVSDALVTRAKALGVTERVTESVCFSGGKGTLSYPLFRLVSGADSAKGREAYLFDGSTGVFTVAYDTLCDTWELFDDTAKTVSFQAEPAEKSVSTGRTEPQKTFTQKFIQNPQAAAKRLDTAKRQYGGGDFLTITHLFEPAFVTGESVYVKSEAGNGIAVASSVSVGKGKVIQTTRMHLGKGE
jgi:hypothetical protein